MGLREGLRPLSLLSTSSHTGREANRKARLSDHVGEYLAGQRLLGWEERGTRGKDCQLPGGGEGESCDRPSEDLAESSADPRVSPAWGS